MIDSPRYSLTVRQANGGARVGDESALVAPLLERIRQNCPDWSQDVDVEIHDQIPQHEGFGSGTQLGMAITEAIGILNGKAELSARELASYSRRGQRSSVGLFGYLEGGFLVDAGHQHGQSIGQIACRFDFPSEWRIVLVTPPESPGVHGADEATIFANLSPMTASLTGQLSHLTLTEILPSLKHADFRAFAPAISTYGKLVGEFFANSQGGVFAHPDMEPFVDRLEEEGIRALAQSSWGPTIAVFASSEQDAEEICDVIKRDEFGEKCMLRISKALNRGRTLRVG